MLHAAVDSVGSAVLALQRPCRVIVLQFWSRLLPAVMRCRWCVTAAPCPTVACSATCQVPCLASSLQASAAGLCVCGGEWGWLAGPYSPGGNKPSQVPGAAAALMFLESIHGCDNQSTCIATAVWRLHVAPRPDAHTCTGIPCHVLTPALAVC